MADSKKRKRPEDASLASAHKSKTAKTKQSGPPAIKVTSVIKPQFAPPVIGGHFRFLFIGKKCIL